MKSFIATISIIVLRSWKALKLWAQTNNLEDDAKKILPPSQILGYGIAQIQLSDKSYPSELDFTSPLVAGNLTKEDFKNLAPKKTRGPGKRTHEIEELRAQKKRRLDQQ